MLPGYLRAKSPHGQISPAKKFHNFVQKNLHQINEHLIVITNKLVKMINNIDF